MENIDFAIHKYGHLAALTFMISAAMLTTPLSHESQKRLRRFWDCTSELDAHVDALPKNEMRFFAEDVLRYLDGGGMNPSFEATPLKNPLRLLRKDLASIPSGRKTQFLAEAAWIFEKGRILSKTTNAKVFVRERTAEGQHLANLTLLLIDEFADHPRFQNFYSKVMIAGNLLDTIKDASGDYKKGETLIKPSVELYFALAKNCLELAVSVFVMHPRKTDLFAAAWEARPGNRKIASPSA